VSALEPEGQRNLASDPPPSGEAASVPASDVTSGGGAPNQLTPEEQMALFEKDLKENDWGHQPC
jgi:hypothetical protein